MTKLYPTQNHPSSFHNQSIVYPVVSRRSGGVSIGINLSPSKKCNFACVYCQVNCQRLAEKKILSQLSSEIDLNILRTEIEKTVKVVLSGDLFTEERFHDTPKEKQVLHDFAFSGDGEPTLSPNFLEAVQLVAHLRDSLVSKSVKLVLITNSTTFRTPKTIEGCDALIEKNGEIWAKLDGLNEKIYHKINRSSVPFAEILDNLMFAASRWPIKIQTMLLRYENSPPSGEDIDSYIRILDKIISSGGKIASLQLYTVARPPIESNVSALNRHEMNAFAEIIRHQTGLLTEVYYSR